MVSNVVEGLEPGQGVLVVRTNRTGMEGSDLWLPPAVTPAVREGLVASGATTVSGEALEVLRIEAGIPRFGVDMDEEIIPLEAGLAHDVDFEKGCHVGQEIVARR